MFLTPDEIIELTNRHQAAAQARQLDFMDITYTKRRDGSLAVLTQHVVKHLGGDYSNSPKSSEPKWSEIA